MATENEFCKLVQNDVLDWKEALVIIGLADSLWRRNLLISSRTSTTYQNLKVQEYERHTHVLPFLGERNQLLVTTSQQDICLESSTWNIHNEWTLISSMPKGDSITSETFTWNNDVACHNCINDRRLDGAMSDLSKFESLGKEDSLHIHTVQGNENSHSCLSSKLKKRRRSIKCQRNRSYVRFTPEEERNLTIGISQFGVGHWKNILHSYPFHPKRTCVDLKDKYRNMLNAYRRSQRCDILYSSIFFW
ncbi:hypothetical protein GpartN1_g7747.t1 [Galdieria partita]|uniref:Myb-like domain-containing protein n=1 Tax=Galdieria partita TaxID=83374 RepID=A0A9C7UUN7_9RHOD|nr:hypothetical protein GpartN1_g7747.t1 [Galdieria partita]